MERYLPIIWLALMVVFAIIEGQSFALVTLWFAFGALVSAILAFSGVSMTWQVIAFFVVSIMTLLMLRPFIKRHVNPKKQPTNADRAIGQEGIVLEKIDNLHAQGQVKVLGKQWTARSIDDSVIQADTLIRVCSIEGIKLIVKPAETFDASIN